MDALGIIFSNIHDVNLPELTAGRTTASIPFCGRYRLIDFALSNMVNSGLTKVGVITKSNYQSLMDHIGSGKDWDLARRHGGLIILPPFGVSESTSLYNTRLEALKTVTGFLARSTEEFVVLSDSDVVCNMDYTATLKSVTINNGSRAFSVGCNNNRRAVCSVSIAYCKATVEHASLLNVNVGACFKSKLGDCLKRIIRLFNCAITVV